MTIFGWNPKGNERFFIKDENGVVESDIEFIRSHPDWYAYYGHTRVNGTLCHTFVLIKP